MTAFQAVFLTMFIAILVGAAARDMRAFRIPNALPIALIALFLTGVVAGIIPVGQLGSHSIHFVAALGGGMALYGMRWFGGGDAKLYAATALFFPFGDGIFLLLWIALAGFGVLIATMGWRVLSAIYSAPLPTSQISARKMDRRIAYGIAIAVGGIGAIVTSPNSIAFSGA
jgi:prepilin peptidase CpaA